MEMVVLHILEDFGMSLMIILSLEINKECSFKQTKALIASYYQATPTEPFVVIALSVIQEVMPYSFLEVPVVI